MTTSYCGLARFLIIATNAYVGVLLRLELFSWHFNKLPMYLCTLRSCTVVYTCIFLINYHQLCIVIFLPSIFIIQSASNTFEVNMVCYQNMIELWLVTNSFVVIKTYSTGRCGILGLLPIFLNCYQIFWFHPSLLPMHQKYQNFAKT